jgi:hypothetical protein
MRFAMTTAKDRRDVIPPDGVVPPEGIEVRPGIKYHPRSPDASPERLRQLLGSIKLTGPAPRADIFDDDEEEDGQDDRAGN